MIKNIKEWLGFGGGISVWQILWEIPDAEVLLRPAGRHRSDTSVRRTSARRTLAKAQGHALAVYRHSVTSHRPNIGRHRLAVA